MYVRTPPVDVFLTPEERDILNKAYSIIDEMCSKVEDCCMLGEREISHEELFELLQSLKLVF